MCVHQTRAKNERADEMDRLFLNLVSTVEGLAEGYGELGRRLAALELERVAEQPAAP